MKNEEVIAATSALGRSVTRLLSLRLPEGHFEGFSDAGVVFDAANLALSRFVGETWPERTPRVAEKMRHILSGQHACGLFHLYPGGPCSIEATRIICLAIDSVLAANGAELAPPFRDRLARARQAAGAAIASPSCEHFELAYLFCFRLVLEALDDNAPDVRRVLPRARLLLLLPVMLVGLLPQILWRRTDRILYPFIAVLPQLLALSAWRAAETSEAGSAVTRALARLPGLLGHLKEKGGEHSAEWLLSRQDSTGGFYYSPLYTFFFVAGLRNAVDAAESAPLDVQAAVAARHALDYIRSREVVVETGISTSFVASDVWDTTAVATSLLDAPPRFDGLGEGGVTAESLGAYVLSQRSASGGFSYGRGSHYPDVDSTGLVIGLFAELVRRNGAIGNRGALLDAMAAAFDFLYERKSRKGGFNAWTIRQGEKPPPMPSELTSLLFDVSSADVTARIMTSLGRLSDLCRADQEARKTLGAERMARLEHLRKRGLHYLLATRDPKSGLWPARWTLGYIIGSRFVFDALASYPESAAHATRLRNAAAKTLLACQNGDGGFGESPDSDTHGRFTPLATSAALVTAAAYGILVDSSEPRASGAASRALAYLVATQRPDGGWPEVSLCTQFSGLYASYELMTQVALVTTLFRSVRSAKVQRPTADSPQAESAPRG